MQKANKQAATEGDVRATQGRKLQSVSQTLWMTSIKVLKTTHICKIILVCQVNFEPGDGAQE